MNADKERLRKAWERREAAKAAVDNLADCEDRARDLADRLAGFQSPSSRAKALAEQIGRAFDLAVDEYSDSDDAFQRACGLANQAMAEAS